MYKAFRQLPPKWYEWLLTTLMIVAPIILVWVGVYYLRKANDTMEIENAALQEVLDDWEDKYIIDMKQLAIEFGDINSTIPKIKMEQIIMQEDLSLFSSMKGTYQSVFLQDTSLRERIENVIQNKSFATMHNYTFPGDPKEKIYSECQALPLEIFVKYSESDYYFPYNLTYSKWHKSVSVSPKGCSHQGKWLKDEKACLISDYLSEVYLVLDVEEHKFERPIYCDNCAYRNTSLFVFHKGDISAHTSEIKQVCYSNKDPIIWAQNNEHFIKTHDETQHNKGAGIACLFIGSIIFTVNIFLIGFYMRRLCKIRNPNIQSIRSH